jgi:hypothetical protein
MKPKGFIMLEFNIGDALMLDISELPHDDTVIFDTAPLAAIAYGLATRDSVSGDRVAGILAGIVKDLSATTETVNGCASLLVDLTFLELNSRFEK